MKESDVRQIASSGIFENLHLRGKVEETHISWVILTKKHAFKIKKPLKLPFLNYSTLDLRKHFCEKEFALNTRFSDIYLGVQPIRFVDGSWVIGEGDQGDIVDYCVVMKRMAATRKMDNRLRAHQVNKRTIEVLARTIAAFHNQADKVFTPFDLHYARTTFNDISAIGSFVSDRIAPHFADVIQAVAESSDSFLAKHQDRMQQRIDHGLKRDVHGDLHSGNIFLYSKPIIFDCIEFNDLYREIDVLYETAFLCMDLEAFRHQHLSEYFIAEYRKYIAAFQRAEDLDIFIYFKCLRANIRAKVHSLSVTQAKVEHELLYHLTEVKKYLTLMSEYMASLRTFTG